MSNLQEIAKHLTDSLLATDRFTMLSQQGQLPVVAFALKEAESFTVFDLSAKLRERGWIVPAYTMAPNAEKIAVLRVVVREGFSYDMCENFLEDLRRIIHNLESESVSDQGTGVKTHGVC